MLPHAVLRLVNRVGNPAVLPGMGISIQYPIGGPRVRVSRLSDAPRVDDETRIIQGQWFTITRRTNPANAGFGIQCVDHGRVGMTNEAVLGAEIGEIDGGDERIQDVFPHWLPGAAVSQGKAPLFEVRGQTLQEIAHFWPQRAVGPGHGRAGVPVKAGKIESPQSRPVMVARQADQVIIAQPGHAFIGLGAVSDDISQAPNPVERSSVSQHSLQCRLVGVNV